MEPCGTRYHARCAVLHRAKHAKSARIYTRAGSCTMNTKLEWNTRNTAPTANARCTPRVLIEDGPLEDLAPLTPLLDAGPKPKPKVHVTKIKVSKRQQARKRTTATDRRSHSMQIPSTIMRRGQGTRATAVTESDRPDRHQEADGSSHLQTRILGRSGTLGR